MRKALLLVDIQNDYFPGGKMELEGMETAGKQAARLLASFRQSGLPTFHIQHVSRRPGAPFFIPGTAGVEIHACIALEPGETVVEKPFPNSFRETKLLELLKGEKVEEVVICGAMSHMCIDATTRAAADLGFRGVVIHDACATRALTFGNVKVPAAHVHAAFMAALSPIYARVVSLEEFLADFPARL